MNDEHYATTNTAEAAFLICRQHPLIYTRCQDGHRAAFYFPDSSRLQRDIANFYDRAPDAQVHALDYSSALHSLKAAALQAVEAYRRKSEFSHGYQPRQRDINAR